MAKHATPSIIHIWLRRLFMVQGNTVPLLRVDEDNEHVGHQHRIAPGTETPNQACGRPSHKKEAKQM